MSELALLKPLDFFRSEVCSAAQSLQLELEDELEFYLVNLLCDFINPAQLTSDPSMDPLATPLAFMLKKALESSPDMQIKVYKRLGDTSLYFAGYFQDYFNRRTYDVGYYIAMGAAAYEKTSVLMRSYKNDPHFAQIYAGLSQEFRKLVAILAAVSESALPANPQDVLATYTRWQHTQSDKLRKILEEQGIPLPPHLIKDQQ